MKPLATALLVLTFAPAPPRQSYDKMRDVTTYSTGDIHISGLTGMAAEFEFPGKSPARPASVHLGYGHLRVPGNQDNPGPDTALLKWKGLTQVSLAFSGSQLTLPAKENWQVSRNSMVETFYGHAVEESMGIELTPDQFASLAQSSQFTITVGKESKTIRGKTLGPLRKLAASIPSS